VQAKKSKALIQQDANRLKRLRSALNMSTRECGKLFGRSHATIIQWESCNTEIPEIGLKLLEVYEKEHAAELKKK
jgi:DNA-binding transcriptional regulator YiaG